MTINIELFKHQAQINPFSLHFLIPHFSLLCIWIMMFLFFFSWKTELFIHFLWTEKNHSFIFLLRASKLLDCHSVTLPPNLGPKMLSTSWSKWADRCADVRCTSAFLDFFFFKQNFRLLLLLWIWYCLFVRFLLFRWTRILDNFKINAKNRTKFSVFA